MVVLCFVVVRLVWVVFEKSFWSGSNSRSVSVDSQKSNSGLITVVSFSAQGLKAKVNHKNEIIVMRVATVFSFGCLIPLCGLSVFFCGAVVQFRWLVSVCWFQVVIGGVVSVGFPRVFLLSVTKWSFLFH